jgi:hypothetical protein
MSEPMTIDTLADIAEEMQDYTPHPGKLRLLEQAAYLLRKAATLSELAVSAVGIRRHDGY